MRGGLSRQQVGLGAGPLAAEDRHEGGLPGGGVLARRVQHRARVADALAEFEIPYEVGVVSAHRMPREMVEYGSTAADRGLKVIVAGAGMRTIRR